MNHGESKRIDFREETSGCVRMKQINCSMNDAKYMCRLFMFRNIRVLFYCTIHVGLEWKVAARLIAVKCLKLNSTPQDRMQN